MIEINTEGLKNKLRNIQNKLEDNISSALEKTSMSMVREIANRNPTAWRPPNRFDGKKYFSNPAVMSEGSDLFDALEDLVNQVYIISDGGKITANIGDEVKMLSIFGYWDLFEGYGIYNRGKGQRRGGSLEYGFTPKSPYGKKGEGFMRKSDNPHPGVLPSFMFRDTLKFYKPIIKKNILESVVNSIKV